MFLFSDFRILRYTTQLLDLWTTASEMNRNWGNKRMCVCAQAGERTTKTVLVLFFREIPEKEEQIKDYKKVKFY